MTSDDRRQEEWRLDDERCVDALLAEGGFPDDAELRAVLLQLRSFRVTQVPEPSAEVAALMGQPFAAGAVRLDDWSSRHWRKKRAVFTSLAVAASLGVAGGAAAGNETLRSQAEGTINSIVRSFSPPAPTTPAPPPPSQAEAPNPAPAVVPSLGWTTPTAAVPAAPAPARVPASEPSVRERQVSGEAAGRPAQTPWDAGVPSAVPPGGGKPAEPGASRATGAPSQAAQPPAGRANVSDNGRAKGKAPADARTGQGGLEQGGDAQGGTGQGSGQPPAAPAQGDRR
ncbi:hypothetical protein [Arthrobacter globiformis]|uniref:hypothetical protein n=1 Tax=Arthrobacter globiformis TaxID=1665 RepID=UPI0027880DE0|nr:hypothetical protein [Arthrobacter globiformis]MDQ0863726.1 hypothetical protein [Arthrobacter globiformis]